MLQLCWCQSTERVQTKVEEHQVLEISVWSAVALRRFGSSQQESGGRGEHFAQRFNSQGRAQDRARSGKADRFAQKCRNNRGDLFDGAGGLQGLQGGCECLDSSAGDGECEVWHSRQCDHAGIDQDPDGD